MYPNQQYATLHYTPKYTTLQHESDSITIHSIQATPEETFLIRYDPSKQQSDIRTEEEESETYNTGSWDQSSIPQQVHISRLPNSDKGGFTLGPGETAVVPITFLPRYPCTLEGDRDNDGLEDYYTHYQVAYSSPWDPDDENFSLAQPDPPKIYKYVSGTARADWEQLLREMPPQERSNWQQQLRQHYSSTSSNKNDNHNNNNNGDGKSPLDDLPPELRHIFSIASGIDDDQQQQSREEWIFEVQTTLIVGTSRGTVKLPVEATSLRQNEYGLPDVIYFDQDDDENKEEADTSEEEPNITLSTDKVSDQDEDEREDDQGRPPLKGGSTEQKTAGVLWLDTDLEDDGEEHREEDEDESPKTYRDCYNLIMSNPSLTEDLRIEEVLLSRPDRMNLQVQGDLRAPSSSINRWWNAPPPNTTTGDDANFKYGHGDLLLEPGEKRYVVTVCTSRSSTPAEMPDSEMANGWLYNDNDLDEDVPLTLEGPQSSLIARAQRTAARAAKAAAAAHHSLGFLQIRTHKQETLFVALEKDRKQCKAGPTGRGRHGRSSELTPQFAPIIDLDRKQAYPPSYHHALYKTQELPTAEQMAKMEKPVAITAPTTPITTSALKAVPPRLDFSLLSSSSPTVVSYLAIRNPKDYPLKIMRSGVAVEIEDDVDPSQPNPEELGLHMSVKILNPHLDADSRTDESLMITCSINWEKFQSHKLESLFFHGNVILRATAHIDFNYHQWIRNLVNTNAKRQQGKILIKNDYADETNESSMDDKQTEFVLEIPLTVSLVEGKIGIMIHRTSHPFPHLWAVKSWKEGLGSVSSIFYPQRAFDIRAELDSGDGPVTEPIFTYRGIDHKLRIFSNIHIPSRGSNDENYQPQVLQIDTATVHSIADIDSDEQDHHDDEEKDVCQRFNIEIGPPPEDNFPFEGFNDVGLVHIQYRFPLHDGDESNGLGENIEYESFPAFPKHCYLTLTTKPYTELHRIPLIVYPGHTDITATHTSNFLNKTFSNETASGKYKKKNKRRDQKAVKLDWKEDYTDGHAVVGFDGLLHWFHTSAVGAALKTFLERTEGAQREWGWNKREQYSEEKLLGQYITNLCRNSLGALRSAHLRPVLLKVGAVKHGTMESASFYMTNHNPIPLLVSIDVGEVEGMTISLARNPTRGRGDGNNILDHFPKKKNVMSGFMGPYSHLVPSGDFRGHPIAGLRKFLQNTDIAQQFFDIFRFRDAIAKSAAAVERQPLLGTLYKKYAFGEFHRDPLPMRFGQGGWSQCRERKDPGEPSQYYDFNCKDPGEEADHGLFNDGYIESLKVGKTQTGPLLLADDLSIAKPLKVCWDRDAEPMNYPSDGTYIIVPPGGVARFELKVNSPPSSMLKDDITRFLSSGLVLSTDHGEILPVLVMFESLLGELQIEAANRESSNKESSEKRKPDCVQADNRFDQLEKSAPKNMTLIQVPASLFRGSPVGSTAFDSRQQAKQLSETARSAHVGTEESKPLYMVAPEESNHKEGVDLHVKSSFSRDVRLLEVSSCNPWFEVDLERVNGSLPTLFPYKPEVSESGSPIGTIASRVNCETGHNLSTLHNFPSFYQCALNWLANRASIQPRGCGLSPATHKKLSMSENSGLAKMAEHSGIKRAMKALEKAIFVSSFVFGDAGFTSQPSIDTVNGTYPTRIRKKRDGLIAPVVLDVFAEAWDAWRVVADFGASVLSSTLKATIEYDASSEVPPLKENVQNLSVSMRDMAVETVMSTPKLFDCKRAKEGGNIPYAVTNEDEGPSVVEFAPAQVADTRSLMLPLRNPTGVPVRVRLGAATTASPSNQKNASASTKDVLKEKFGVEDEILKAFTEHGNTPFVQSSKLNVTNQHYHAGVEAEQLWWDGPGGYYLADIYGDLIRSHHNVRIMAGAGAHVSIVNPSLHSNIALIAGCGARCGVKDDKQASQPSRNDNEKEPYKIASPIGAAAASGYTLAGRTRSTLPQANVRLMDEPSFSAGAATPGGNGGPAAFAIPFSALDEIIIPPYGEVELGPILFRPPGRYSIHGCEKYLQSRAVAMVGTTEKAQACSSNLYQSMVYLENSLTGLERISLRGKALWEHVIFIDPPPLDPMFDEDYGDIELRNGRSTLLFSGSKDVRGTRDPRRSYLPEPSVPGSVIKEVLVYNQGDTTVDFAGVYLSDSARLHRKRSSSWDLFEFDDPCSYKQFRLVNCWDEGDVIEDPYGEEDQIFRNVKNGFVLDPGQNISLFLEHFPDCSRPQELIALNLERQPRYFSAPKPDLITMPSSGAQEHIPRNPFRQRKLDLLVGFDMTDQELKECKPVKHWVYKKSDARCVTPNACKGNWATKIGSFFVRQGGRFLNILLTTSLLFALSVIIYDGFTSRKQSSLSFSSAITTRKKATVEGASADRSTSQPPSSRGNWGAAFRCLARADPSSSDLQTLGREQIRHVVLGRYKALGILSPQCFNSHGVFIRERVSMSNAGSTRQITGKEGAVGSNDRIRTLSDAMYRNFSTHQHACMQSALPCGLAWRAAVARGVNVPEVLNKLPYVLKTSQLLLARLTGSQEHTSSGAPVAPEEHELGSLGGSDEEESSTEDEEDDQYTEEGEEEDEESDELQGSVQSELGKGWAPDTPDAITMERLVNISADNDVAAEVMNSEPIRRVSKEQDKAESHSEETSSRRGNVSSKSSFSVGESVDSDTKAHKESQPTETEKLPPAEAAVSESSEKALFPHPEGPQAVRHSKKIEEKPTTGGQEPKPDRRTCQQPKGTAPSRVESGDKAPAQSGKQSQGKEPKAKKAEAQKGSTRQQKGKVSGSDADKPQADSKQRQPHARDKNKLKNAPEEAKATKGTEAEVTKGQKRKGKKGDNAERKKQSKDDGAKNKATSDAMTKATTQEKKKKSKKTKAGKKERDMAAQDRANKDQKMQPTDREEEEKNVTVLRPPPGLAPPPGFGGENTSTAQAATLPRTSFDAQLLPPSAFLSDSSILGSRSSTLGTPSRGTSAFGGLSPSLLNISAETSGLAGTNIITPLRGGLSTLSQQQASGEALLATVTSTPMNSGAVDNTAQSNNSTAGFDVMDFLDSILNEGNNAPEAPSPQPPQSPFLQASATAVPPLSSNPWATERKSRASAYGIVIDESGGGTAIGRDAGMPRNESGDDAGISMPILSTTAILYGDRVDQESNDGEEDDDDDNGDSFYASLLGGHQQNNNNQDEDDNYSGRY